MAFAVGSTISFNDDVLPQLQPTDVANIADTLQSWAEDAASDGGDTTTAHVVVRQSQTVTLFVEDTVDVNNADVTDELEDGVRHAFCAQAINCTVTMGSVVPAAGRRLQTIVYLPSATQAQVPFNVERSLTATIAATLADTNMQLVIRSALSPGLAGATSVGSVATRSFSAEMSVTSNLPLASTSGEAVIDALSNTGELADRVRQVSSSVSSAMDGIPGAGAGFLVVSPAASLFAPSPPPPSPAPPRSLPPPSIMPPSIISPATPPVATLPLSSSLPHAPPSPPLSGVDEQLTETPAENQEALNSATNEAASAMVLLIVIAVLVLVLVICCIVLLLVVLLKKMGPGEKYESGPTPLTQTALARDNKDVFDVEVSVADPDRRRSASRAQRIESLYETNATDGTGPALEPEVVVPMGRAPPVALNAPPAPAITPPRSGVPVRMAVQAAAVVAEGDSDFDSAPTTPDSQLVAASVIARMPERV